MNIQATALTALAAAAERAKSAAEGVSRAAAQATANDVDSANLSEEAVRLLAASREFEAAVELARTGDELARTTIDLLA